MAIDKIKEIEKMLNAEMPKEMRKSLEQKLEILKNNKTINK